MSVIFSALDGSNPLAFLAALGTCRLLHSNGEAVKMRWLHQGVWRPQLAGVEDPEAMCTRLMARAKSDLPLTDFERLGENITVDPGCFSAFVEAAYQNAKDGDRRAADFAAAFGSEVLRDKKGRIQYTDLCFITGSGHQDFLGTMKSLCEGVSQEHIHDALFGDWKKLKGLSLRWDPSDAAEYAFRWGNPSVEGASSVWGANLLAIHALPLFPAHPTSKGLCTTGFREVYPFPEFSWPIWTDAIAIDSVRSLLALAELHVWEDRVDHKTLRARGIEQVYRSPRVRIGQGANFKVSFRPAKAV